MFGSASAKNHLVYSPGYWNTSANYWEVMCQAPDGRALCEYGRAHAVRFPEMPHEEPVGEILRGKEKEMAQNFRHDTSMINKRKANLAQKHDASRILKKCRTVLETKDVDGIVLYGHSRGAGAISRAAEFAHSAGSSEFEKVKAIVLENPFASVQTIALHALPIRFPGFSKFIKRLYTPRVLKGFDPRDFDPIDCAHYLPNVPILIFSSIKDEILPPMMHYEYYRRLKVLGRQNVYLVQLENSWHCDVFYGGDKELVSSILNAFEKKHDLGLHDELQMTCEEADEILSEFTPKFEHQPKESFVPEMMGLLGGISGGYVGLRCADWMSKKTFSFTKDSRYIYNPCRLISMLSGAVTGFVLSQAQLPSSMCASWKKLRRFRYAPQVVATLLAAGLIASDRMSAH